ncbi:hypothetical protein D1AOALGA4SA_11420 [Olavius algarvensis Delta 1 endosymbiont]|nr:hypothetical protein D1AOALGA4SA_11420 [Olavius algarvensis Delta 1 endosymbiont]
MASRIILGILDCGLRIYGIAALYHLKWTDSHSSKRFGDF